MLTRRTLLAGAAAAAATAATTKLSALPRRSRRVLVVVSSQKDMRLANGTIYKTGFYMNELGIPVRSLMQAGYQPIFANPLGNAAPMDAFSDRASFFGGDVVEQAAVRDFVNGLDGLKSPLRLADLAEDGVRDFAGVFIPGGHAPMIDLAFDPDLGSLLCGFHRAGKPTASICHGPVALASAVADPAALKLAVHTRDRVRNGKFGSSWSYAGYRLTVFSDAEERNVEARLGGAVSYTCAAALQLVGGRVLTGAAGQSNVVVDRELITGQNPASDAAVAERLVGALGSADHP